MAIDFSGFWAKSKEFLGNVSAYAKRRVALRKIKKSLKERLSRLKNRVTGKKPQMPAEQEEEFEDEEEIETSEDEELGEDVDLGEEDEGLEGDGDYDDEEPEEIPAPKNSKGAMKK